MIVQLTRTGWNVIYQPAHGLLATKIAYRWRRENRSPFWVDVVAAITQHDNNQRDFEGDTHLTDLGAPRSFTVDKGGVGETLEQPRRRIAEAKRQGRYVALLTSMHLTTIYARGQSAEMDAFLDEQEAAQKGWRRSLGVTKAQAERDYAVMIWCDRCSLILCQEEVPQAGRRLEVQRGPDGAPHYLWEREDGTLGVDPWPFEVDDFEVGVDVTHLEQLKFASDEELLGALERAPVELRTWRFRR